MTGNSNPRKEKAQAILRMENGVKKVEAGTFEVRSQTGIGAYRVENRGKWNCNCPDWIKREEDCKHVFAARYYIQVEKDTPEGTVTERVPITYGQAWSAYNRAQMDEVRLFDKLLADLVAGIPEPEQTMGRPRIPLRDEIFCAVQKVYSQLSCRRAHSLFQFAAERGQIPHVPGYVVSSRALNREDATAVLHDLITKSALPLAVLEDGFAPDSTGIRTTSFGAWNGTKHGERREHVWLKAHALAGVKTHIIARIVITDKDGADCPQFEPLVRGAKGDGMTLKEVYADKAYSSRGNYNLAGDLGFDLYIPFKDNSTGRAGGSPLWRKAFLFFQMHREEFEAKYHARSNVESVFSALKRKFGEALKSKNRVAQENELLAKVLAYNLTVLIHEIFEHGIIPDFLQDREAVGCVESQVPVSEVAPAGGF